LGKPKKPDFIVYGRSLNDRRWKRCGVAWTNRSKSEFGYVRVALDFMPASNELTIWPADGVPEPSEGDLDS
jgi:hypothetical protein